MTVIVVFDHPQGSFGCCFGPWGRLGESLGGPVGGLGGPWEAWGEPGGSMGVLGGPWGGPWGSLGTPWGVLWGPWGSLGGPWGDLGDAKRGKVALVAARMRFSGGPRLSGIPLSRRAGAVGGEGEGKPSPGI